MPDDQKSILVWPAVPAERFNRQQFAVLDRQANAAFDKFNRIYLSMPEIETIRTALASSAEDQKDVRSRGAFIAGVCESIPPVVLLRLVTLADAQYEDSNRVREAACLALILHHSDAKPLFERVEFRFQNREDIEKEREAIYFHCFAWLVSKNKKHLDVLLSHRATELSSIAQLNETQLSLARAWLISIREIGSSAFPVEDVLCRFAVNSSSEQIWRYAYQALERIGILSAHVEQAIEQGIQSENAERRNAALLAKQSLNQRTVENSLPVDIQSGYSGNVAHDDSPESAPDYRFSTAENETTLTSALSSVKQVNVTINCLIEAIQSDSSKSLNHFDLGLLHELRESLVKALLITGGIQSTDVKSISPDMIDQALATIDLLRTGAGLVDIVRQSISDTLPGLLSTKSAQDALIKAVEVGRSGRNESELIVSGLPEEQVQILEGLLGLSDHDIRGANAVFEKLSNRRLTQKLTRSISNILRRKKWRIICQKPECSGQSTLRWKPHKRYKEGGFAQFAHPLEGGGYTRHCGLTLIDSFMLVKVSN